MPAQHLVVEGVIRPLQMRRAGEQQLLRRPDVAEPVLAAVEVRLVGVAVPAGAGISRHLDVGEFRLALFHRGFGVVRIDQHIVVRRHVLAFLRDQIVDVRIHLVVGIVHGLLPHRLALRRQRAGRALVLMHRREMADQIAEQMDDAAGIFVAEAAELAVSAARVERENRAQMRRLFLGHRKLLGAEAGNADHADGAVAPRLRRDPFDQVVAIPLARAAAFGLADAARRADDMDVAARHEEFGVAGLHRPGPQRRPGRLRRQGRGHVGALKVLVVDGEGEQRGKFSGRVGAIDVDADFDAVAHRHHDVHVACDRRKGRLAVVIRFRIFRRMQQRPRRFTVHDVPSPMRPWSATARD